MWVALYKGFNARSRLEAPTRPIVINNQIIITSGTIME